MEHFYKIIDFKYVNNEYQSLFDTINNDRKSYVDFNGLYLQTSYENAMNYIEHKANMSESNILVMIEFNLKPPLKYIKLTDSYYGKHYINSHMKANKLKQYFNLTENSLLMDSLNNPIMILENETDYELIIPHHLFNDVYLEYKIIEYFNLKSKKIGEFIYKYTT